MKPIADQYERYRNAVSGQPLPLALVDLDRFDSNVRYVAATQQATGKTIRVHTKSVRCVELLRRIFRIGGSAFRGVMTFAVEETALLAAQGFDDFIIAYPTVQPSDIDRFIKLTAQGTKASLMVDSLEHLEILEVAAQRAGVTLHACLEVDTAFHPLHSSLHLGMRRSPVRTPAEAIEIARHARYYPHVKIDTLMGYEAHIAGLTDKVPGAHLKNAVLAGLKRSSMAELMQRRGAIVAALREAGLELGIVNGGGSGSLRATGRDPAVTEVTAGSAFYASGLFWHFKEVSFLPAAFFAVQVVRRPAPNMVACLGGGYVASGSASEDKLPVPVYPEGLKLLPLEGAGEVQTPLLLPKNCPKLRLGDPIFFQHAKAGELAERFNEFHLLAGNRLVDQVKTYRGEGRAFL